MRSPTDIGAILYCVVSIGRTKKKLEKTKKLVYNPIIDGVVVLFWVGFVCSLRSCTLARGLSTASLHDLGSFRDGWFGHDQFQRAGPIVAAGMR